MLDVAVDIRKGLPTYGRHVDVELTEENHLQFFVPRRFAHGFVVHRMVRVNDVEAIVNCAAYTNVDKAEIDAEFAEVLNAKAVCNLADVIFDIIENRKYNGNEGIYYFSNEGVCSWYDFTKMIAAYAGNTACDIQPCHSDEFPSPVVRPSYSVLDKTKFKKTFGWRIPYWTDSLKICIDNLKEQTK